MEKKLTNEEFIAKAKKIHGELYDYSKVNYVTSNKKLTNEEFIAKAKKIHGDLYDYSKVNYVTSNKKVTIVCPTHGEFEQTPASHLKGMGSPKSACIFKK